MVAIRRKPLTPAIHSDYMTDVLHGLNVRLYNYLDLTAPVVEEEQRYPWEEFEPQECWVVGVWDDGLDYDLDGNAYFDDYPDEHPHSYHATQRGAEVQAAYLEHWGIEAHRIRVYFGQQNRYDYDRPIEA